MKKIIFYIILTVLLGPAMVSRAATREEDKNLLTGTVTDAKSHQPLAGASVYFPDLKTGTITGSDGHFSIKNLPAGSFLVQVQYIGYGSVSAMVTIKGAVTHDFQLSPAVLEQSEVVVTGSSAATEARKSPTPISVISMQQIRRRAYTNIIDAVAKQPGISQVSTGPAISKPVIRGLGYNRVVVINDGIRQEGQQWGDEHGIEVDDYNVSKIEILKGPASLMYGSDALAGVVNIISNLPVPEGTVRGNLTGAWQSNSGLWGVHGNLAGNLNGFNWNAYGTRQQSHDYRNKYDGYVFNSRFNETNFGGYVGLNKSWGYSHLQFASFNENLGLVEGERDDDGHFVKPVPDGEEVPTHGDFTSYQPDIPRQRIVHNKAVLDNNFYLGGSSRLALILGFQQNLRKEYGEVETPDVPGLSLRLNTFNYDAKYFLPALGRWQTSIGVNGMAQHNINEGMEFLIPDYHLFDIGAFAYVKRDFDRLSLSGGLRFDNRHIQTDALRLDEDGKPAGAGEGEEKFSAVRRNFSNVSASAGLSYAAGSAVTLKVNIARGFRAPNAAELSANGVHEGTIRYEYGNTALHPEVSTEGDLGLEWNSTHVSLNAGVFYNDIRNYIFSRKLTGAGGEDSIPVNDNEEGYAAFQYQQTHAHLYGGELTLDIHPHPLDWLHFENSLSYVRGTIAGGTDSTGNLPMMPATRWVSELRGDFLKKGKGIRNLYVKIELDRYFRQNEIFSAYRTETVTPGYSLLNAGIGADIVNHKGRTLFSLNLSADNLADVAYQNHLSRLKYADENPVTGRTGVFDMGRNFSVKVNVPLNFK
ncbi:TonB-dependent receptor [Compostibacter hankyongensis]|uniref:TonB-dependent receptor n=1 Tax=Compostibacter hankyongensis TaxID=1007089 RepID=A0ABP8G8B1_9BACT